MEKTEHTWKPAGSGGRWVAHSSTGHGADMIGVGQGEDMLGPFASGRQARTVANALENAYRAGLKGMSDLQVDALAAALADTRSPVIIRGKAEPHTLARPYDLAAQLLAVLGARPEPQPGTEAI